MHHPLWPVLPEKLHSVPVCVPVVDDHRQAKTVCKPQLGGKNLFLHFSSWIVLPMIIQADFPHGHHFGQTKDFLQLLFPILWQVSRAFRVNARRAVYGSILAAEICGKAGGGKIRTAVHNAAYSLLEERRKKCMQILLKLPAVVMGVGIENV